MNEPSLAHRPEPSSRAGSRPRPAAARSQDRNRASLAKDRKMAKSHPFDPELVRELAGLIKDTDLTEIEVEKGDLRIRVARNLVSGPASPAPVVTVPVVPPLVQTSVVAATAASDGADLANAVTSPMVGTAYRRPSPGAKTFVEVGSQVRAGDKLLLIEAMKTFNDIVSPRAGTVREIFVEDGQPVEYGEPLIVID